MGRQRWILMPPEDDYEDMSPIYSDEPYLSFESEVEWLEQMSEHSTHAVREAIAEQIKLMEASKDHDLKQRASMRIERGRKKDQSHPPESPDTYFFKVKSDRK